MTNNINTFEELEIEVKKLFGDSFRYNQDRSGYELFFDGYHNFFFSKFDNPNKILKIIRAIKQCKE